MNQVRFELKRAYKAAFSRAASVRRQFFNEVAVIGAWVRSFGSIGRPLQVIVVTGSATLIALFGFAYVYRFHRKCSSSASCRSQRSQRRSQKRGLNGRPTLRKKKASRLVIYGFLLAIAYFGAGVTESEWADRPRIIDRFTEWRMVRDLSKYPGTTFQVVASPQTNGDYTEMCNLRFQLDDILKAANWVSVFGECNRPATFFGSDYTIEFDSHAQDAMLALDGYLAHENWGPHFAEVSYNRGPIPAMLGTMPAPGGQSVDIFINIYDHAK